MPSQTPIWVAAAADATDPNGFGGLPYNLVAAGKASGLIAGGFAFDINSVRTRVARVVWNAGMLAKTGRSGGFQYSETFLNQIWASVKRPVGNYATLNIFQLFPEREMNTVGPKYFYLDQTLRDVFEYYGAARDISPAWAARVVARETAQYRSAHRLVFRSKWAAERASTLYRLPDSKIQVVLPGANLDAATLDAFDREPSPGAFSGGTLRLVFIGKDWERKGLDRLLRAMGLARHAGADIALTVIGAQKTDLPKDAADGLKVDWHGFVDKSRDPVGFVRMVSRHDLGVLLSRSEAGGVSLREFGRLGLSVIAPDTGGSPEFAMSDTAQLVAPDAEDETIANLLVDLAGNQARLREMKAEAWNRRKLFDWKVATARLADIL